MLPDRALAPDPELDACCRLLIRCADALSAQGRRLRSLDLTSAVSGTCATALSAAAGPLARELLALGGEIRSVSGGLSGR